MPQLLGPGGVGVGWLEPGWWDHAACGASPLELRAMASSTDPRTAEADDRRYVYLLTLPAVTNAETTREIVADDITFACESESKSLRQFAVFMEKHRNGTTHFHATLRFEKQCRWKGIAEKLRALNYTPHFSTPGDYLTAYKYCVDPSEHEPGWRG